GQDGKQSGPGRISRGGNNSNWNESQGDAAGATTPERDAPHNQNLGIGSPDTAEYVELTINEILNGSPTHKVTGLLTIVLSYLPSMGLEYSAEQELRRQLVLIRRRASGKLCTLATWMRNFVQQHPDYRHDSVVSPKVNYDMLCTLNDIEEGRVAAPELLKAMMASLIGYVYIRGVQRKPMLKMNGHRWKRFFQVALLSSSASPFGYMALRYINYPTMTLAKTCKMVPVVFMNKLLYRRHYPAYKYAVVAMVTAGVSAFMLFKTSSKRDGAGTAEVVEN
ncbi:glutamate--cysteine ligase, partial [Coemansia sp. S610]